MNGSKQLESIYYITLPENFSLSKNAMHIDKTIPLPVQKKDKDSADNFNMEELTSEQILSGILTVLAYDKANEHLDYYRNIIKDARPNLKQELSAAAILKTKNQDYDLAEEIYMALRGFDPDDVAIILNTALFFDQRADSYRRSGLVEDADAYDSSAEEYYKMAMDNDEPPADAFGKPVPNLHAPDTVKLFHALEKQRMLGILTEEQFEQRKREILGEVKEYWYHQIKESAPKNISKK